MKQDLIKQAEKLQKELDILKLKIKQQDEVDIFSITTYKQVCEQLKEKEITKEDFDDCVFTEKEINYLLNVAKIKQLERFFNQDWKKDWNNQNQPKWYPYFRNNSGWSFYCSCYFSYGSVGVVAFYKNDKISAHVGKHFFNIYKEIL